MSTRSRIAIQLADGNIQSCYCHYDGYPSFNGKKLKEHFNSYEKAKQLIAGGDISALWTNAGFDQETLPETGPLYYSTRGEDCPPAIHKNLKEYRKDTKDCWGEYAYFFSNGEWICWKLFCENSTVRRVKIPAL
jgi:hypothetical protein